MNQLKHIKQLYKPTNNNNNIISSILYTPTLRQQYINPSILQCNAKLCIRYAHNDTTTNNKSNAILPPPPSPSSSSTSTPNIIHYSDSSEQLPPNFDRRVIYFFSFWGILYIIYYINSKLKHRERDIDKPYKNILNDIQYNIVRLNHTEMPYTGEYVNHWNQGIYYCICCNKPLFSSEFKFDSGYGWATFSRCIDGNVKSRWVNIQRVELDCIYCAAHVGTIYGDGPQDSKCLRYNVNSNALVFKQDNNIPPSRYRQN